MTSRTSLGGVRGAGLLYRAPWHAVVRLGIIVVLYGIGWAALFLLGNSWYQFLVAAYLAVVFGQLAFFGHDVGHRQLFAARRVNRVVGLACGNFGDRDQLRLLGHQAQPAPRPSQSSRR